MVLVLINLGALHKVPTAKPASRAPPPAASRGILLSLRKFL